MAKRLSAQIKKEILDLFVQKELNIEKLAKKFECTGATITRNLKNELGNEKYKEIVDSRNSQKISKTSIQKKNFYDNPNKDTVEAELKLEISKNDFKEIKTLNKSDNESNPPSESEFIEIAPLDYEIENIPRKELSSVPIGEIEFPKIVYMIVNKNIELEIKLLKDYPEWEFLPNEDLKRKTIEIYFDLKTAKRVCNKEQKVIKVPNTDVFRIASPFLISRGISRIVSADKLIAI